MFGKTGFSPYLQFAGASSAVFLLVFLCAPVIDQEWILLLGFVVALLLLGALVLVPQMPARQRRPLRTVALVCLPLLAMLAAEALLGGTLHALDLLTDRDLSASYDDWVLAAAQLIWIPAAAYAAARICQRRTCRRFQAYVFFLAASSTGLVAVFFYFFGKCLLRSCPDWMTATMVASVAIAYSILPPGLATAFYFGTTDDAHGAAPPQRSMREII